MPILGLTDRPADFPNIGQLRKGSPKINNGYGKDLKHFRFTSEDASAVEQFYSVYHAEPSSLVVYLPYPHVDQNFEAWRESWSASKLNHRCDGQVCYSYNAAGELAPNGVPCPDIGKPANDQRRCKQVGRLKVILPELGRFGYVTLLTSSIHDIVAIHSQLLAVESLVAERGGTLAGIPFRISRQPRSISTPRDDGKRARVVKYLINIEVEPTWAALRLAAMADEARMIATSSPRLALPAPADMIRTIDHSTGEITDSPRLTLGAQALMAEVERQAPGGWHSAMDDEDDEDDDYYVTEDTAPPYARQKQDSPAPATPAGATFTPQPEPAIIDQPAPAVEEAPPPAPELQHPSGAKRFKTVSARTRALSRIRDLWRQEYDLIGSNPVDEIGRDIDLLDDESILYLGTSIAARVEKLKANPPAPAPEPTQIEILY